MLYEISCKIGSRYNGIPLYIYLTFTLCIMAVILQTRCFQMDNCEPDLSFSKYVELDCFRRLYIYGHICDFFPGMLNSSSIFFYKVNSLGIGTNWRQQDPGNRTIKTSGTLWTDEYLQVVMTSQNVVLQELQILLKEGGGVKTHFSDIYLKYFLWNSYQVNTTHHWSLVNNGSGNGLVPSSNKPLHEPMFTQISGAIWRH